MVRQESLSDHSTPDCVVPITYTSHSYYRVLKLMKDKHCTPYFVHLSGLNDSDYRTHKLQGLRQFVRLLRNTENERLCSPYNLMDREEYNDSARYLHLYVGTDVIEDHDSDSSEHVSDSEDDPYSDHNCDIEDTILYERDLLSGENLEVETNLLLDNIVERTAFLAKICFDIATSLGVDTIYFPEELMVDDILLSGYEHLDVQPLPYYTNPDRKLNQWMTKMMMIFDERLIEADIDSNMILVDETSQMDESVIDDEENEYNDEWMKITEEYERIANTGFYIDPRFDIRQVCFPVCKRAE